MNTDEVPDGDASAPHHSYIGWLVQVLGVGVDEIVVDLSARC